MTTNKFKQVVDELKVRMNSNVPGSNAHEPMRAKPIGQLLPKFEHKVPPKRGSVLILLYEENGIIKLPLIKRPTYPGAHSGQVSLPGGKVEPDEDAFQAALREGQEEIGVIQEDVQIIGRLSDFNVLPSNFIVSPIIGAINYVPNFLPDTREVEKIIFAELSALLAEDAIKEKEILAAGVYPMIAPHFLVEDEIVWGATAMMLNEFRVIAQQVLESK
jgi:8-oxo-dGTP pyrophosphatase MutT (NUDIX family)